MLARWKAKREEKREEKRALDRTFNMVAGLFELTGDWKRTSELRDGDRRYTETSDTLGISLTWVSFALGGTCGYTLISTDSKVALPEPLYPRLETLTSRLKANRADAKRRDKIFEANFKIADWCVQNEYALRKAELRASEPLLIPPNVAPNDGSYVAQRVREQIKLENAKTKYSAALLYGDEGPTVDMWMGEKIIDHRTKSDEYVTEGGTVVDGRELRAAAKFHRRHGLFRHSRYVEIVDNTSR